MRQRAPRCVSIALFICCLGAAGACSAQSRTAPAVNNIGYDMYFNAAPVNDPACRMTGAGGKIRFDDAVSNPAMSCPDLLAWKIFIEVVQQNFIQNWNSGDLMWPAIPLPLCSRTSGKPCCDPASDANPGYDNPSNPGQYCPYFPSQKNTWSATTPAPAGKRRDASRIAGMAEVHGNQTLATLSLSFYNRPMYDYIFQNNLYNSSGLVDVLNNANADLLNNAPFHAVRREGMLTAVNFPISAWMIRSQWISKEKAIAAGVRNNPQLPFIKVMIGAGRHDNFNSDVFAPGEYWLMSFHVSTKDTPPWFWANFDHVNSPGRCDYTGCNDGYGYVSANPIPRGMAQNYTNPATTVTPKGEAYVADAVYASGAISKQLDTLFAGAGIGTSEQSGAWPTPRSSAWRSYRLRASQWDFTDPAGRPTYNGATLSNGRIMTGTSCISCHATAGTLASGVSPQILGVYFNWAGVPNPGNFNMNARPATNIILQNDFVWGFMHTVPVTPRTTTAPAEAKR